MPQEPKTEKQDLLDEPEKRFRNFNEFYKCFMENHRHPHNRKMHLLGFIIQIITIPYFMITRNYLPLLFIFPASFIPNLIGHWAFESPSDKPREDRGVSWVWSARAHFTMVFYLLIGKLSAF